MALQYSGVKVELREVLLKDKPESLLKVDSAATVPLLQLQNGDAIDESWPIMLWALRQNDPQNWLGENEKHVAEIEMLLEMNDYSFKPDLDHYKYADRYPEFPAEYYRLQGEEFLQDMEELLGDSKYLMGEKITAADIAIFPFIRQFANVDKPWFDQSPYSRLQVWLEQFVSSSLFDAIMEKFPVWHEGDKPSVYPVVDSGLR